MQIKGEALAGHLAKGLKPVYVVHGDQPLRVVVEAVAAIGVGPCPVEDVLAVGVVLLEERRRADEFLAAFEQDEARMPPGTFADAAAVGERPKETEVDEGIAARVRSGGQGKQPVPVLRAQTIEVVEDLHAIMRRINVAGPRSGFQHARKNCVRPTQSDGWRFQR